MVSFNSHLTIAALPFFLFTFYSVIAINEHDTNAVYDGQLPRYSSIYPDLANLEQNVRNHQIPPEIIRNRQIAEISATIPAHSQSPYSSQSLSKMEIDIWDMLSKNLSIPENYNSVPWGNLVSEITNKAVQKKTLVKLAELSTVGNDFKFNKDIRKMMQAQWSFDSAIRAFKENNNYEMLALCLHLGWRFDNADFQFVNALYQKTNDPQYQCQAKLLVMKMLQVKNIINGTRDAFIDYFLKVENPESFIIQTFSEFMINQLSPEQKQLFFERYLFANRYKWAVNYLMDHLSPDQKAPDIVPTLIEKQSFDMAAKLIEKGWPIDQLNAYHFSLIRSSGHSGIKHATLRSVFQKHS